MGYLNATVDESVDKLVSTCHEASYLAGWWRGPEGMDVRKLLRSPDESNIPPGFAEWVAGAIFAQKLTLIHSEVSEAMEGDRKNLPDDKLPQYPMRVVELADALIRIADLAGAVIFPGCGYTFGDVVAAKLAYNATRADHRAENRAAAGGKAY